MSDNILSVVPETVPETAPEPMSATPSDVAPATEREVLRQAMTLPASVEGTVLGAMASHGFVVCDDQRIYGAGMDEDTCLDNALECLCGYCERSALKKMLELCQDGVRYPLRQIPASETCVAQCLESGPTIHYCIMDGVAYSPEEIKRPLSA